MLGGFVGMNEEARGCLPMQVGRKQMTESSAPCKLQVHRTQWIRGASYPLSSFWLEGFSGKSRSGRNLWQFLWLYATSRQKNSPLWKSQRDYPESRVVKNAGVHAFE